MRLRNKRQGKDSFDETNPGEDNGTLLGGVDSGEGELLNRTAEGLDMNRLLFVKGMLDSDDRREG
jgi:hypothetical protein